MTREKKVCRWCNTEYREAACHTCIDAIIENLQGRMEAVERHVGLRSDSLTERESRRPK